MYTEMLAKFIVVRTITSWVSWVFAGVLWIVVVILQGLGFEKTAEGLLITVIVGFPCAAVIFGLIAIKQFIWGEHPRSVLSPNEPVYKYQQTGMPPWHPVHGYPDGSGKP